VKRSTARSAGRAGRSPRADRRPPSPGRSPPPPTAHRDGETLALRVTTPKAEGRYTYRFHGDDRYEFKIENSFDGGKTFVKFMKGTYRRSAGASGR
jgi:hypothetical protein